MAISVVLKGPGLWTGAVWTGTLWTGAVWTGALWTGALWTGVLCAWWMWTRFCGLVLWTFMPQVHASGSCLIRHDSTRNASTRSASTRNASQRSASTWSASQRSASDLGASTRSGHTAEKHPVFLPLNTPKTLVPFALFLEVPNQCS